MAVGFLPIDTMHSPWVVHPYLGGLVGPSAINTSAGLGVHIHYENILTVINAESEERGRG